jgi:acylphosphatase
MNAFVKRRVFVTGLVQGVGFRAWIKKQVSLVNSNQSDSETSVAGVNGMVRNLPDGRVEAFFEGNATGVLKLVTLCGVGPASSKVDSIEVLDEGILILSSNSSFEFKII